VNSILDLYCAVDDFWVEFEPVWRHELLASGTRLRAGELHPSELMTILIWFHASHYRTFKAYYTEHVRVHLRQEFPHLVSYSRVVELMPSVVLPLTVYLQGQFGACSGISFVDSTPLAVCHPARISQHRVFAAEARQDLGGLVLRVQTSSMMPANSSHFVSPRGTWMIAARCPSWPTLW
jgi:Transposase DDE domain